MSNLPLYALLQRREAEIIALHNAGDTLAKHIVDLYRLHCTCPADQAALTFLTCAVADFERAHPEPETQHE